MVGSAKIQVLSLAKLQAIVMAFLGLLAGIVYSFGGVVYEAVTGSLNSGTALAFLALLGMPALFAIIGFFTGIIEAVLYNFIADRFGGLHLRFDA